MYTYIIKTDALNNILTSLNLMSTDLCNTSTFNIIKHMDIITHLLPAKDV